MVVAALLATLLLLVRRTPKRLTPFLAAVIVLLVRPFVGKDVRRFRDNVHRIYGLPPGSHFSRMFERQCMRHQVQCALETLQAMQDPGRLQVTGFDELTTLVRAAEARGKAHVLITAHLGAWELAAFYGGKAGSKTLSVLAKPSRYEAVTRALDELRKTKLGTPVLWTGSKTLLREMLSVLKRTEPIGFVMDQKPDGRQGPVVSFFGIPTPFVSGPAAMALRADAAVLALFVVREGAYRYRIVSETIWGGSETGALDETALTSRMASAIERAIRAYPEQWTWNYKRWRWDDKGMAAR